MIVISNGMPKSGSTLLTVYIWRILVELDEVGGQETLLSYVKQKKIDGVARFLFDLRTNTIGNLENIDERFGTLLVKVHQFPTSTLLEKLKSRRLLMTFTYRDPRDVILSLMDHRKRTENLKNPQFKKCIDIQSTIPLAKLWANIVCKWIQTGLVCVVLYDDLILNPKESLRKVVDFFRLDVSDQIIDKVIIDEENSRVIGKNQLNTGQVNRYLFEMNEEERGVCVAKMKDELIKLDFG